MKVALSSYSETRRNGHLDDFNNGVVVKHSSYVVLCCALLSSVQAQTFEPTGKATQADAFFANTNPWLHGDVWDAWAQGYKGAGATISVVDYYSSFVGKIGLNGEKLQRSHGSRVLMMAGIVARDAELLPAEVSGTSAFPVTLPTARLNIINTSYSVLSKPGSTPDQLLSARDLSIVQHARNGAAVVVKAAGNFQSGGAVITSGAYSGTYDYLSWGLHNTPSAIIVGALERNGSVESKSRLASYSNYAGSNKDFQRHFLVVGVNKEKLETSGTSFAAPIIAGYAAIVGNKFHATPTQVVSRLLDTARKDTIENYRPEVHGQGEASLSRALAPRSIR